jgi:hypothetical protein
MGKEEAEAEAVAEEAAKEKTAKAKAKAKTAKAKMQKAKAKMAKAKTAKAKAKTEKAKGKMAKAKAKAQRTAVDPKEATTNLLLVVPLLLAKKTSLLANRGTNALDDPHIGVEPEHANFGIQATADLGIPLAHSPVLANLVPSVLSGTTPLNAPVLRESLSPRRTKQKPK